ncbi:MAG: protein phosphatase 2C domain-containing protein [Eubacteriales bacterium]|nr:protein phosphatase 2C domain-containing protein [Eubacteriales bacterium]
MEYIQSYYTDIGNTRSANQDSLAVLKAETHCGEVLFAVLCDGMGGHESGELASKTVVERMEIWFKTEFPRILYRGITMEKLRRDWDRVLREVNETLVTYGKQKSVSVGSTVTAFLFWQDRFAAVHVGDSRGYEIAEGDARQVTEDQSFLADQVRKGILTPEEAELDPRKNLLLECVGVTSDMEMLFYSGKVQIGNSYLLCSDGFWHTITERELIQRLSGNKIKDNKMLRIRLTNLTELAMTRGEKDNISVIGIVPI